MSFPSIDYAFAGYDVVEGYPLSKGRDPGFRAPIFKADYLNGKSNGDCRYMLPKGITAIPDVSCDVSFKSSIVKTAAEFHNSLSASANIQGGGWGFEFSASASYQKSSSDMASRDYLYVISRAMCTSYFSRIEVLAPPPFDEGFLEKAKALSKTLTDEEVNKFIETYGTHFLDEVTFGSSYTHEHRMSTSKYESLSKSSFGVSVQAGYSGMFSVGGGFSLDSEQQEAASTFSKSVETTTVTVGSAPPSNGDTMTWAAASKDNPVPVAYRLRPIADIFTSRFFSDSKVVKYKRINRKLLDAAKKSCEIHKSKGAPVSCTIERNLNMTKVTTISGGYPLIPSVASEFMHTFYLTASQADCELMCSVDKTCIGYTSVPPTKKGTCRIVQQDGSDFEWHGSSDRTFTIYLNKMVGDLVLTGKVPEMYIEGTKTFVYAYFKFMYPEDPKDPDNPESVEEAEKKPLQDCRSICVRDPKCLAFRFGKCDPKQQIGRAHV